MFVFLMLSILYPNGTLAGFAKATKTCPAAKWYWRPLNSKRSLPVLKWTSKCEYSLSSQSLFADNYIYTIYLDAMSNHLTPRCACAVRGNNEGVKAGNISCQGTSVVSQ